MSEQISVVDFFCGCGGTSLGLQNAGAEIVLGIDNDEIAASTFKLNFPKAHVLTKDVRQVSFDEISSVLPSAGKLLFAGCAPCQPFSAQNQQKSEKDERRYLLTNFQQFVEMFLPDYVLIENVPGLQNSQSDVFKRFVSSLHRRRYSVDVAVVSAAEYSVPQTRRRLVLVASRYGQATISRPNRSAENNFTVRDAIFGLPPIAAGQTDPNDDDHAAMGLSPLNLERIRQTPEGGGRESWTKPQLQLICHQSHQGHSDVYGRLAWDRPASAMTTRCVSYSNGRFGHPVQDRAISLREAALIQTFPRDFRFQGSLTEKARQVGNAVPPRMAEMIGRSLWH